MTKSDGNFALNFVDHHLLSDVNFNGYCLINNIYIPKKVIFIFLNNYYYYNILLENGSYKDKSNTQYF